MSDRKQTVVNVNLTVPEGMAPPVAPQPSKSMGTAVLLWLFLGFWGAHRFYLERPHAKTMLGLTIGGIVLSFAGVGFVLFAIVAIWCLVDVFSLSNWVKQSGQPLPLTASAAAEGPQDLQTRLLEEAEKHRGRLTVTQAVKATGESFADVEACLQGMLSSGYVDIDNEPQSGVIVYVFREME